MIQYVNNLEAVSLLVLRVWGTVHGGCCYDDACDAAFVSIVLLLVTLLAAEASCAAVCYWL